MVDMKLNGRCWTRVTRSSPGSAAFPSPLCSFFYNELLIFLFFFFSSELKWHRHIKKIQLVKIWHTMVEDFIIKYYWGAAGMMITALPIFFGGKKMANMSAGGRTEGLVTNRKLLQSSADAFGRMMYSYKEVAELAGYTARVRPLLLLLLLMDNNPPQL